VKLTEVALFGVALYVVFLGSYLIAYGVSW
jgi:hypothetical protein